jgi:hypothetical protein
MHEIDTAGFHSLFLFQVTVVLAAAAARVCSLSILKNEIEGLLAAAAAGGGSTTGVLLMDSSTPFTPLSAAVATPHQNILLVNTPEYSTGQLLDHHT